MGILDDAIRQHLDLKRQHGADDSEVKQLEDEAFGPPTRPGEPDFPESQDQPIVGDATDAGAQASAGEDRSEDATALLDPSPPATEEPTAPAPVEQSAQPATEEPMAPASPAETTFEASEQPSLEPEAVEQAPVDPVAEDSPAPDGGGFYDQASEAGEAEPSAEPEAPPPSEPEAELPAEPAQPISEEHPIELLETEEHPMEELLADEAGVDLDEARPAAPGPPATDEQPLAPDTDEEAPPPVTDEEPLAPATDEDELLPPETGEEPLEESGETDAESEDVLEETPEFLRDQPEDDELWFEQGEPKDFDF